jgi:hypothetical protein
VGVGTLDKEILFSVDGVKAEVIHQVVDIIEGKVELAAEMNPGPAASGFRQFANSLPCDFVLKRIPGIRVGCGYQIGRAVLGGSAEHDDGFLKSSRAIVDVPDDMAVDICHVCRTQW